MMQHRLLFHILFHLIVAIFQSDLFPRIEFFGNV
jgi:hypothetical protein